MSKGITMPLAQVGHGKSGTARVWNSGPPPHVGWWNASMSRNPYVWRFWDGTGWRQSNCAPAGFVDGACVERLLHNIEWSDYYPENARVPRVDPSLRENRAIVEFINISITSPDPKLWEEAAWKDYHFKHAPAAAGSTRTVREMKERMKPGITSDVPARMSSNGQPPAQIPERREIGDPFHGISTMALMKEVFRRLG